MMSWEETNDQLVQRTRALNVKEKETVAFKKEDEQKVDFWWDDSQGQSRDQLKQYCS